MQIYTWGSALELDVESSPRKEVTFGVSIDHPVAQGVLDTPWKSKTIPGSPRLNMGTIWCSLKSFGKTMVVQDSG